MRKLRSIIKLIRLYQWTKSGFIFLPFIFSDKLYLIQHSPFGQESLALYLSLVQAFLSFSFMASTIYVLNDLKDVELDRQDPKKRHRPLASGVIRPPFALGLVVLLFSLSLLGGYTLSLEILFFLFFYFGMNLFYTGLGKKIILLDVFIISIGYVIRVMVGSAVIHVEASPWLLSTTFFIALFLGFFKRYYEVSTGPEEELIGGSYSPESLKPFTTITASLSIVNYSIYTVLGPHAGANLVWTIPFVVMGIFRYYILLQSPQKLEDGNPSDLLLADRFLILVILGWVIFSAFLILNYSNGNA